MLDARLQAMLSPTKTRKFGGRFFHHFWQVTLRTARSVATQSTILTAHTKSLRSPHSHKMPTPLTIQSLPLGRRRLERLHEELHALLLLLIALCRVERHEIL